MAGDGDGFVGPEEFQLVVGIGHEKASEGRLGGSSTRLDKVAKAQPAWKKRREERLRREREAAAAGLGPGLSPEQAAALRASFDAGLRPYRSALGALGEERRERAGPSRFCGITLFSDRSALQCTATARILIPC